MALPTNTFRPRRYFRSKFREAKYLLAAEATDLQLESFEQLQNYIKKTFGDVAVGPAFRVDKTASNILVVRPGEAWNDGIPFVLKSGTDAMVVAGDLPANVTLADLSRSTSDIGGKQITFGAPTANDTYAIVIEAVEEIVKEAGSSGAVDPFLQGVNVGEGTSHKFRFVHKIHVIPAADLMSSPTFPLVPGTKHYVNEIEITPTVGNYYLLSSVDMTPDINGADRQVVFKNDTTPKLPFSTDAQDYIFGKLVDSDGNVFTITSITPSDGGNTVVMSLDREVAPGSVNPKAGLPVITTNVPYRLIKRDHYVTDSNGIPLGKRYFKAAEVTFTSPNLSTPVDSRVVSEINSFGSDSNVRLREGGIISWDTSINLLSNSGTYEITLPGVIGKAQIAAGSILLTSAGDVAYVLLDRTATVDYPVVPTVVTKANVPSNVDVYILAERGTARVHFPHNGSIGDGESGFLGGFGSELAKDLSRDNLTDMLTEVQMDEVFAETFDLSNDIDLINSQSMTFEQFNKLVRSGSSARFIDYHANTLPNADPDNPWTLLGNGGYAAAVLGILTLTDSSVGDYVGYRRTEASLTPLAHSEHKFRMRMTSGTGTSPFTYMLQDGATGKEFGLRLTTTDISLVDGAGTVLQTFALDGTTYHIYELVKLGSVAVQWYVDGVMRGSYKYASITTPGSANQIEWKTSTLSLATVDIDYVVLNIYTSVFQSKDLFRKGSVFYEGFVLPASDTPSWTKVDGAGGITEVITNNQLVLTDAIATNLVNYYRNESVLTRHGDADAEIRVKIASSGRLNFQKFGIRVEDGAKDMAAWITDVAGQLKVALYNATSGSTVSGTFNIDSDKFISIRIRKTKDSQVELLINNVLTAMHSYDEFTDVSANKRISFGSFAVISQYIATIDFVQYALPGFGFLAATPVRDLMAVVSSDDPSPITWVSSDNGITWFRADDKLVTSIADLELAGANLIARIGLSTINSVLTDYGIYYNKTAFEVDGPFRFITLTATAGQTVFELPFAYTPGVNELIVSAKYVSGDSRELFVTDDYTENDATHVTLTSPAAIGDKFKFRVFFTTDPLVVPIGGAGFLGHDHDGSGGESDVLNPTEVNVVNDLNVGGYINGASPLKLSGDNTGVKVGTGLLGAGTLEQEIRTAAGGTPSSKLTRGSNAWQHQINASGELELYSNGFLRAKFNQYSDLELFARDGDLTETLALTSTDVGGTGDASLELRVNNNAQRWAIYLDNSDSDKLAFDFNGVRKLALRTDGQLERSANVVWASSSGAYSTTSSSPVLVTNQSITITTHGRPVKVSLQAAGAPAYIGVTDTNDASVDAYYEIRRNGSTVGNGYLSSYMSPGSLTYNSIKIPPSCVSVLDAPAAGTYTYTLYTYIAGDTITSYVYSCQLVAEEL